MRLIKAMARAGLTKRKALLRTNSAKDLKLPPKTKGQAQLLETTKELVINRDSPLLLHSTVDPKEAMPQEATPMLKLRLRNLDQSLLLEGLEVSSVCKDNLRLLTMITQATSI